MADQLITMIIPILTGVGVLLLVIGLGSSDNKSSLTLGQEKDKSTWLWTNGAEKLYDAIFQNKDPATIAKKLGLEYDKYMLACAVSDRVPNIKKETMNRVIAFALFFAGIVVTMLTMNPFPIIIGITAYYMLIMMVVNGAQTQAKLRRKEITHDLPRFADLLHSALIIGIPIELALEMTAKNLECLLSSEIKQAIAVMKMGANDWQGALEELARKYEVDTFSDFVLDLITATKKGVPIVEAVARKSVEIKQDGLYTAKEKVSKMTNQILLPVAIFKILPLVALLMIPVVMQIFQNF